MVSRKAWACCISRDVHPYRTCHWLACNTAARCGVRRALPGYDETRSGCRHTSGTSSGYVTGCNVELATHDHVVVVQVAIDNAELRFTVPLRLSCGRPNHSE